jgi:hypothetical protein
VPSIQTAWEGAAAQQSRRASERALVDFRAQLAAATAALPVASAALARALEEATLRADALFDGAAVGSDAAALRAKLDEQMAALCAHAATDNDDACDALCVAQLARLRGEHVAKARVGGALSGGGERYESIGAFLADWSVLEDAYAAVALGPTRGARLREALEQAAPLAAEHVAAAVAKRYEGKVAAAEAKRAAAQLALVSVAEKGAVLDRRVAARREARGELLGRAAAVAAKLEGEVRSIARRKSELQAVRGEADQLEVCLSPPSRAASRALRLRRRVARAFRPRVLAPTRGRSPPRCASPAHPTSSR